MTYIDSTPSTTHPCPDWCTLPAGHGVDGTTRDGTVIRSHERAVARMEYPHTIPGAMKGITHSWWVAIVRSDMLQTDDGPVIEVEPVTITVSICDGDNWTAPQARQLAAALLDAADEWDEITGAALR